MSTELKFITIRHPFAAPLVLYSSKLCKLCKKNELRFIVADMSMCFTAKELEIMGFYRCDFCGVLEMNQPNTNQ